MFKPSQNQSVSNLMWLWQKSHAESGNTLIIAMSLGLLLIAATTTAIVSSTRNKTNVTATEASVQAVEVAELGVTRSHNFLAQNPEFVIAPKPDSTKWDATNGSESVSSCTSNTSQVVAVQEINAWDDVGASDFVFQNIPPLIDNISKWEREAVN